MEPIAWLKRVVPAPAYDFARRAGLGALGSVVGADVGDEPLVSLTFDDGPGPRTGALLDVLAQAGARATFFLMGKQAQAHPDAGRAIARAGHEIANHTFSHRALPWLAARDRGFEMSAGRDAIRAATGYDPRMLRPPYGFQSLRSFVEARRAGWEIVGWSVNGEDWTADSAETIAARVLAHATPGDIVLLHDSAEEGRNTVAAVKLILEAFRARGLRSVTVSDLLAAGSARRKLWFRRGKPQSGTAEV